MLFVLELVEIYSNLLLKKDKGSDKGSHDVLFASVLQKLFELSGQIPAMNANLMLSFFKEVFRVNRLVLVSYYLLCAVAACYKIK